MWKYCSNISQDFLFFISFVLSQPSSHPYVFLFLFFLLHTLSLYLYPPSFICSVFLLQEHSKLPASAGVALILQRSLSFFFSIGHYGQSLLHQFSTQAFPPDLGRRNLWAWRENFLSGFPLSLFSSLSQTVENTVFHSVFHYVF